MWRVLILSSLLLAAQGACGGAPRPAAGPTHDADERIQQVSALAEELRRLEADGCCPDVLAQAQDICSNRDETCELADELGDNAYADEKCLRARRACRNARDRCATASARPQIF